MSSSANKANVGGSSSSIRRTDLLALSNLRADGRKPNEIRRLRIQFGALSHTFSGEPNQCTGSAIVEMGLTVALAKVIGPTESVSSTQTTAATQQQSEQNQCIIDVTVQLAPFADHSTTIGQTTSNPATDRKLIEMSLYVQHALENCIFVQLYNQSTIYVSITVLQDDGNRLCTVLNAAICAIMDAGIPIHDICCACTAGYSPTTTPTVNAPSTGTRNKNSSYSNNNNILVDLNRKEEIGNGPGSIAIISVAVMSNKGSDDDDGNSEYSSTPIVWTICDTGRLPDIDTMEALIEAAMNGCIVIMERIRVALREHATSILLSRNGTPAVYSVY